MNKVLNAPALTIFAVLVIPMILLSVINSTLGMFVVICIVIGWLCLLGLATNKLVPTADRFSIPFFIFRLAFSIIYIFILSVFWENDIPSYAIPVHILAVVFLFSCLWTCAKTIVIAETQNIQKFDRYIGTFLMLWFFPIGIWFVQPRLNRLAKMKINT